MTPQPGDFAVVRTRGLVGWAIRLVTRSPWNHAVVFVTGTEIVEANPSGAARDRFRYVIAAFSSGIVDLTDAQRAAITARALELVGTPYGFLDLLSLGCLQYGIRPRFIRDRVRRCDRMVCSQLVDACYDAAGVHLFPDGRTPMDVTPGDLGRLLTKGHP